MTSTTNETTIESVAQLAIERRDMLKLLARSANLNHRRAASFSGAAVMHVVAAGNALALARDLCEEGGWTRWLRTHFQGSIRTAQRYMRVAMHVPSAQLDATRVSPPSQRALLRAIRGAMFSSVEAERPAAVAEYITGRLTPPARQASELSIAAACGPGGRRRGR